MSNAESVLAPAARAWVKRRREMDYRPGTVQHARCQLEFFLGAYAMTAGASLTGLFLMSIGNMDATDALPDNEKAAEREADNAHWGRKVWKS